MRYARMQDAKVAEIIDLPDDTAPEDAFHPDIVATLVACQDDVAEGWLLNGTTFSAPTVSAPDLIALKSTLKTAIDQAAEAERLNYITGGAGQAMTYSQKADEAQRYLAAADPKPADYPLLSAEVGITAADIVGVAAVVDAAYRKWQVIGAAIEAVRLGTKAAIDAATTIEKANAAHEAAAWPSAQT